MHKSTIINVSQHSLLKGKDLKSMLTNIVSAKHYNNVVGQYHCWLILSSAKIVVD